MNITTDVTKPPLGCCIENNSNFHNNTISNDDKEGITTALEEIKNSINKLYKGDIKGALEEGIKICQEKFEMQDNDLQWVQEKLPKNKQDRDYVIHNPLWICSS